MTVKKKKFRGWCINCGTAHYGAPSNYRVCEVSGEILKPLESITPEEKAMVDMQDWLAEICKSGKNGPSPGGAATELGCHRSMIDRLVGMGILEKSEFSFKGQKLIVISKRSLEIAKENRKKTGNWTGHPVHRGA